ncbi:hypothetical protein GCM10010211_21700 [Streptomyces albospinus]|uniref:Secreted protein n=1 Tax=Streptomyces albospinus TaxID=285515 RepID=A0ABQ2UVW1_9ACTN|nr:hypothetical protein GCM10010211_21700 [Streptomyces albospinus]
MRRAIRRLAATTGVPVAAGALPIVATAPAYADTAQCAAYLSHLGYKVGPNVVSACKLVGEGGWTTRNNGWPLCDSIPTAAGVKGNHASRACDPGLEN